MGVFGESLAAVGAPFGLSYGARVIIRVTESSLWKTVARCCARR